MSRKKGQASRDGRERTQRQLRVGETIRHSLVQVLARGEIRDPDLNGVSVTVTEVRVSPDLKNATAFVMPLGGEGIDIVVTALNRAAPFLRRSLAEKTTMRYLPRLSFIVDTAFEHSQHIDELLHSSRVAPDLVPELADDSDGNTPLDPD
jgi:ribosome-binding factor A